MCVYTQVHRQAKRQDHGKINNGLGFISPGSDTHTCGAHYRCLRGYAHTTTDTSGFPMSYLQGGHRRWHPGDIKKKDLGLKKRGDMLKCKVRGGRTNTWKKKACPSLCELLYNKHFKIFSYWLISGLNQLVLEASPNAAPSCSKCHLKGHTCSPKLWHLSDAQMPPAAYSV